MLSPAECYIRLDPDRGTYTEVNKGKHAFCLPAHDRLGNLESYVAWLQDKPEDWYIMAGLPCPVLLGADVLLWSELTRAEVHLVWSPEAWAAKGGECVCILNWRANIERLFPGDLAIRFEDTKLEIHFRRHWCRSAWKNAGFDVVTDE